MKRLLFIPLFSLISLVLSAQTNFDLGIKGGLTNSDFSLSKEGYTSESILSYHIGAFGRLGFGRLFLQPEAYFSSRTSDINQLTSGSPSEISTRFDFKTIDVPVLAGIRLFKSDFINVRAMGGPLFNFVTSKEVDGPRFGSDAFRDNFCGWQYGIGFDIWMVTLDARFENSRNHVIRTDDFNARNKTFIISAGIKLF